jgi:adenosylhomocysteine nucleosidase
MRILVTYAVQGEFTELKFPGLIGRGAGWLSPYRCGKGEIGFLSF